MCIGVFAMGVGFPGNGLHKNQVDILQNSKNVVAWILNDNVNAKGVLNKYRQRTIKGTNKIVFENLTNY